MLAIQLLRACLAGRRVWIRSLLLVAVAAAAAFALAAIAAAPGLLNREAQRASNRQPVSAAGTHAELRMQSLLMPYRLKPVTLVYLHADSSGGPMPPGLSRIPRPGQMIVSPAAQHALSHDPVFARWLPYRDAGVVDTKGIADPDEMLAYIGVPAAALSADDGVSSFGGPTAQVPAGVSYYRLLVFVVLVIAPALVALIAAARSGPQSRKAMTQGLQIAGLSRTGLVSLGAAEVALPALVGSLLGLLGFSVVSRFVHRIPVIDRGIVASDVRLPITTAVVIVVLLGALAGAAGAAGTVAARGATGIATRGPRHIRPAPFTVLAFGLGLGAMVIAVVRAEPADPLLRPALLIVALTIPVATVVLGRLIARTTPHGAPLPLFLAGRRLARFPGAIGNLVAVVSVLCFALSATFAIEHRFAETDVSRGSLSGSTTLIRATATLDHEPLTLTGPAPAGVTIAPAVGLWNVGDRPARPPRQAGLVATCNQLRHIADESLPHCRDGIIIRLAGSSSTPSIAPTVGSTRDHARVRLPAAQMTLRVTSTSSIPLEVTYLIPPGASFLRQLDGPAFITAAYARTPARPVLVDRTQAYLVGSGNGYQVESDDQVSATTSTVATWFLLGVVICLALALLTALTLSLSAGRHSPSRALNLLGASSSLNTAAAVIASGAMAVIGTSLAALSGLLATRAITAVDHDPTPALHRYLLLWAACVLGGAVLGAIGEAISRHSPA